MRERVGLKLAEWALRLGGAAVMDYMDKVRLINTPTYGHRVYTSPDGRVLVIDPVTPDAVTFTEKAGAVQMPKRVVFQVTSYGQPPARAELSHGEAMAAAASIVNYLGHLTWQNDPGSSAGGFVPTSSR